ncbi:hypothetical protein DFH06DRAFT_626180 [Mycena polygramma]|nr:hypothetical protein DFH06DRAFT_626180 [Mycena polygramma]
MHMHIDDLPTELLVDVFHEAKTAPPFDVGGTAVLIPVSQVSQRWRSIALDSPPLWSDLRLSAASSLCKLSKLLARSKELPVSISMVYTTESSAALSQCWDLFNAVVKQRFRIYALDVSAPSYTLSLLSRAIMYGNDFPRLRHLGVIQGSAPHLDAEERTLDKVGPWRINLDAPQLQSLNIAAITPDHIPCKGLRTLQIKASGYLVYAPLTEPSIDALFSDMHTLSITSSPLPSLPAYPTDTHVVSFTLAHLRPADIPCGTLARLFSILRMPSLQHLAIEGLFGYLWDEFVSSLAEAHYPALRSVTFESLVLTGMDAPSLRALTSVSTLRLVGVDPEPIVRLLESTPLICPGITVIDRGEHGQIGIRARV